MTRQDLTNLPASVHQRLLNLSRQTKRPFNELLQYYAIERFLFRLSRSPHAPEFVRPETKTFDELVEDVVKKQDP